MPPKRTVRPSTVELARRATAARERARPPRRCGARSPRRDSGRARCSLSASSAALPSSATRPTSSTTARSATASAIAAFCSTSTTVTPWRLISRITSPSCSTIRGARPSEGSSSSSTRGPAISARPIASICCSPPESRPARLAGALGEDREQLVHPARGRARAPPCRAPPCPPARRFSATVRRPKIRRPSGTCTSPPRATSAGSSPIRLRPASSIEPPVIAPRCPRRVPDTARSSVLLPAPLFPSTATTAPSGTSSDTPSSARTAPA